MQPDERYDTISSLNQGQRFTYQNETYLKLPKFVECYGESVNAVNLKTGTLVFIDNDRLIDLTTMTVE